MKKILACLCSLSLVFSVAVCSISAGAADVGIEQSGETVKAGGFTYELNSSTKEATITGFNQTLYSKQPDSTYNNDHKLVIPTSAKGNDGTDYTVTGISILGDAWKDGKEANTFTIVTVPKDVEWIRDTFTNITSLEYVQFEEGSKLTTQLREDYQQFSFEGCSNLKRVGIESSDRLPEGITNIRDKAFYGCESLESITLPSQLTSIGYYYPSSDGQAFRGCKSLKKIVIPPTVETIVGASFKDCSSLETVIFDTYSNGEKKGKSDLHNPICFTDHDYGGLFENCTSLKNVQLPVSSVKNDFFYGTGYGIPDSCFKNTAIETITIPESVTSIGVEAFADTPLKGIILPSTCSAIKRSAFARTKLNEKGLSFNGNAFGLACFCKTVVIDDNAFNSTSVKGWNDIITENDVIPTAIAGYEGNVSEFVLEFEDYGFTFISLGDWNPYTVTYKGDVSEDGIVDIGDAMMVMQYIANWPVEVNESTADVTKDGIVDVADVMLLMQSIAGWNVTLN